MESSFANPAELQALLKRAVAAHQAGDLAEAARIYAAMLQAAPDHFDALHLLGVVESDRGHQDEACRLIGRALAINPRSAEALFHQGGAQRKLGQFDEALASYDRALIYRPDYAAALNNRGNVLRDLNRHEEALASYGRALALRPDFLEALNNRGNTLHVLGRHDEAVASCDRALSLRPDYAEALSNRANALRALGRYEDVLATYERMLALGPDDAVTLSHRGNVLQILNRHEEALASYDRALALKPDYAEALNNRGTALQALNRLAEALASYDRALALKPEYAEAHWNESLALLLCGDFERGWQHHEWRRSITSLSGSAGTFAKPLWLGDADVAGKTILLHAEYGLGDTLQFCRYAPMVAARRARVLIEAHPALKPLLATLDGVSRVLAHGEALPDFDLHCPLLSLPLAFKTRLDTVPASVPYLAASPALIAEWETRLGPRRAKRVGLVWAGSTDHNNDRNRSAGLARLLALVPPGWQRVSLQKDLRGGDAQLLAAHSDILRVGETLRDFADTAAVVAGLDLVISVDTAVAHLAGAMGKEVWVLLPFAPDWRWLRERADSPWYPSARLFRQPKPGDWDSVVAAVRGAAPPP